MLLKCVFNNVLFNFFLTMNEYLDSKKEIFNKHSDLMKTKETINLGQKRRFESHWFFFLDMDHNWNGAFLPKYRQTFDVYVWVEISDHPLTIDGSTQYVELGVQIGDDIIAGKIF